MSIGMHAGGALAGGALSAFGASACCGLPLALSAAGVGGAWMSSLSALEPFQPLFVVATLVFLALAYRRIHRAQACAPDIACAEPPVRRRQRALFWIVALVAAGLIASPWYVPLLA